MQRKFSKILVPQIILLLCSQILVSESIEDPKLRMSAKIRICYQNLGFGLEVNRKWHDLMNILQTRDPHILYVSETLIDPDAMRRLEALGYTVEAMPLVTERIWACVKDGVHYKRRADLELPDFPGLWIEVGTGKSSYLCCGIYREFTRLDNVQQSRKIGQQRERFQRFLQKVDEVNKQDKEIHVIGDANLNVKRWVQIRNSNFKWKFAPLVDDLYDYMLNQGFVQNVNKITRIHNKVESILDLHMCNRPNKVGNILVTHDTKSDHATITVTRSKPDQVP